ncbi:hypothetical protein ACH5RR_016588 [Cinchona calisaya]|uniref:Membrane-associated kinase regulator 4 n=1 Tax=Cinchona calisaya TaxID=153742 RepID=A0ABD2ZWD8_9GENT
MDIAKANRLSCDHAAEEEDYIDMEVGSTKSAIFSSSYYSSSPQYALREFEFQMSSSSDRDAAPSPADELFYKGKLLPLHLPPRLQMVEKLLLQNANINNYYDSNTTTTTTFEEYFSTPLFNNTPTANNTPFESCNISPSDSCHVSRELSPEEYLFDDDQYSTELASSFVGHDHQNPYKKSWTKKLKLIKQSSFGSKLKASRSYLKSFFSKSACTNESCAEASRNHHVVDGSSRSVLLKANECVSKYAKVEKKIPFGQIQNGGSGKKVISTSSTVIKNFDKETNFDENGGKKGRHRRSFSGAIKRISMTRSSSSLMSSSGSSSASSSANSNGFQELQFFKRSNSVNSDVENPIQAAIAYCKRSQQLLTSRKTVSDLGFCSLASSKVICEDQRPGLCRG